MKFQFFASIEKPEGYKRAYSIERVEPRQATTQRCWRVVRLPGKDAQGNDSPRETYGVAVMTDGTHACTCQGWQKHRKCKHVDVLAAMGLFDPPPPADIVGRVEELVLQRLDAQAEAQHLARVVDQKNSELRVMEAELETLRAELAAARQALEEDRTQEDKRETKELREAEGTVEQEQEPEPVTAPVIEHMKPKRSRRKTAC